MTNTTAETKARIDERIAWANEELDNLGSVTAEDLVRPFRQWMCRLAEIGHMSSDLEFVAPLDERTRDRAELLVAELSRAADLVTSIVLCDVPHPGNEVAARNARGLFEVTTEVANLRAELSYQTLAKLQSDNDGSPPRRV